MIACEEIIDITEKISTKIVPTNFNEKKFTCKSANFYILLAFSLITISIIDSCSYLLLPHKSIEQKHLLPSYHKQQQSRIIFTLIIYYKHVE